MVVGGVGRQRQADGAADRSRHVAFEDQAAEPVVEMRRRRAAAPPFEDEAVVALGPIEADRRRRRRPAGVDEELVEEQGDVLPGFRRQDAIGEALVDRKIGAMSGGARGRRRGCVRRPGVRALG